MTPGLSVLFLGKKNDAHCGQALEFIRQNSGQVEAACGTFGEKFPDGLRDWQGDVIVSYLSRWIVPKRLLRRAKLAINFHPAPPEYPGIGCNNFALYENASQYGATCHHMAEVVDSGQIIGVKRFPVFQTDTVASLLERTYAFQLTLFYEIMGTVFSGGTLPASTETWTREAFTRDQLNELSMIDPMMSAEEIRRRVRAVTYGPWRPTARIGGMTFELTDINSVTETKSHTNGKYTA
jgi:methionyl-tRNA formyltransferase